MDNALVASPSSPLVPMTPGAPRADGVAGRWQALPARSRMLALAGAVLLVAVLAMLGNATRESDWRVLFPGLSEKDGGLIIERLAQMNVPYRFSEGGGTILVPARRVHELRMKLVASGLPLSSVGTGVGYELLDKTSFGQTQGQERMNVQRAIEGELTRTIQSLGSVHAARVHLALPNQNGFFREQQKPSASVVLTLHPGRTLDRAQIAGIVHLVSSSVPEMNPNSVHIIDGNGTLLSNPGDRAEDGLDSQQMQYRRELENTYLRRVMALLEPVVGRDNLRASVDVHVDFTQVLQTAEAWRPNQGPEAQAAVRELRTEESSEPTGSAPGGVPGATTNQPGANATAPITGPAQALQPAQGAGGSAARRESATRFELDKTTTVTRNAVGNVRRVTAAVVVNHRTQTDARGRSTQEPLSEAELQKLTALVQQSIGFDAGRGDAVSVISVPFRQETPVEPDPVPLWEQPWVLDLVRSAAAPLSLALLGLVAVLGLLRPAVKVMMAPSPGRRLDEVVGRDDGVVLPPPAAAADTPALEAPRNLKKLESARQMARENPAAVANIVRGWVNGEAA
jgi:flagellar M-ring protein FliF